MVGNGGMPCLEFANTVLAYVAFPANVRFCAVSSVRRYLLMRTGFGSLTVSYKERTMSTFDSGP